MPAPKKVATAQAQRVFSPLGVRVAALPSVSIGLSAMISAGAAEVFEDFRIEDGRADLVDAGGPFAQVDFAAAVAAEREVLVFGADQHGAGGAAEQFGGFFLCGHK